MTLDEDLVGVPQKEYGADYHAHILEIYKLFVESADKISERRQTSSSFFLTLNSALVALIGYINVSNGNATLFWPVSLAGMILCYLWYRSILSYKNINAGKFKVIHAIENLLPLRPFDAEWTALGREKNPKLYIPFTRIEGIVPWVFFLIHLIVVIMAILK